MPETTVASNKWKIQTDEFSPACDNSLMLDSDSISSFPMKMNRNGICTPECSACLTAFPAEVDAKTCVFKTLPYLYEVSFPAPVKGHHPWTSCFEAHGDVARYSVFPCYWYSNAVLRPVVHSFNPDGSYGCGRFLADSRIQITLMRDTNASRGALVVDLLFAWGTQGGHFTGGGITWLAKNLTSPFGEIRLFLDENSRNDQWQYFNIPAQITAKSISG